MSSYCIALTFALLIGGGSLSVVVVGVSCNWLSIPVLVMLSVMARYRIVEGKFSAGVGVSGALVAIACCCLSSLC